MTSTPPSRPPAEHTLLATTDAMVWAEEFCRIFTGYTILPANPASEKFKETRGVVDEGGMVGWFANAIETGRNIGRKETCSHDDTFEMADDLLCCRTCGFLIEVEETEQVDEVSLLEEDEDEEMEEALTLEEQFLEGFKEGR